MIRSVAIVGAGIGAQHLEAYAALPDRFRVKTVCDLDLDRASKIADQHEGINITDSLVSVLADKAIDIVDVCLPPKLHFQACCDAMDAGKVVICEKPLVTSLSQADALAAKARETGSVISPVFQYRYGIGAKQLSALIDAGLAGRCFAGSLETHWNRQPSYYDVAWRGTWCGEQGGAILGHAIHIHDLLTMFLGTVGRVYADITTRVNAIETEDCAAISLRMSTGALITSSVTLGAATDSSRLRLMFEGFTVESDHAPYSPAALPWRFFARTPTEQSKIDDVLSSLPATRPSYVGMFSALADALDGQPGAEVTLEDGRRSLELVTAIYESARSGLPVDLPLGPECDLYESWAPTG